DLEAFRAAFAPIAREFDMRWRISDSAVKKRVVLMASKESHCLADLLHRWQSDELDCSIVSVISNHDLLRSMVERHGIAYHHVLARYMQILPPDLCRRYAHQVINIHHSFLPSFVGAKPYHQASMRGVKLIGATSHYVTEELDAGPIIEQDVVRVSHRDSIEEMVRLGKDVEKMVLARGLRYHLEDRVLVHDNKTVVFD